MPTITILAVGKLKERYFSDACAEYVKRLGAFCKINIIEVDECRLPQDPSPAQIQKCIEVEGQSITARLPKAACVIPLCIEGRQLSSTGLAKELEQLFAAHSSIAFLIGGSHGIAEQVKQSSVLRLSLSSMTFPHQLARVMLLEQIYRAFSINGNLKYHK